MNKAFHEVKQKLLKPRMGYLKRGIPIEHCETIWLHGNRTCNSCIAIIEGTPERIKNPKTFPIMGLTHDWVEWDTEDYTPSCNITSKEKHQLESESLKRLRLKLGVDFSDTLDTTEDFLDGKSHDAKELYFPDKSLAGIGGLEYERLGFTGMGDFHPYALDKISGSKYHTRIYEILLEREFQKINFFTQYFLLLRLAGDYEDFRREVGILSNKFH